MFPRIVKNNKKNGSTYEYLVISQSVYKKGKGSTTKNIANLGNVKKLRSQDLSNLIDGLIKIFRLEEHSLSKDVEIIESLEHGSIIFWQKIYRDLGLSKIIKNQVRIKNKRITFEVEKYIEMMAINRCINPLSKLGITRWIETTCYKEMKGYSQLSSDVTYFYRSMDHLLKIKDKLELAIFERLKNLFSINVKLTFYDITSSFFYSESCPLSNNGYSRDNRPDKEQIIIGIVTSYEGYPLKHFVFTGNTKDETTVKEIVSSLKSEYNIEETIFVGDRGMITKLNLDMIIAQGFDYIMGVKVRQDEICNMLFSEGYADEYYEEYNDLKLRERKVKIKDFLLWKTKEILSRGSLTGKENIISVPIPAREDERFSILEEKIRALTNRDEIEYHSIKTILIEDSLSGKEKYEEIDSKICRKIFNVVKRYIGKYENELRYIICLNEVRRAIDQKRRDKYILRLSKKLDNLFSRDKSKKKSHEIEKSLNKIFEGYKSKYRRFFEIERDNESQRTLSYKLNQRNIENDGRLDGIFVLLTSRDDIEMRKVVESYKNLREVEMLFDDLKNFVDIRPIRHWLEVRVRAHVFICVLALLLKRIFEINYLGAKSVAEPLEEISKCKLVKYKVKFSKTEERSKILPKVTNITPLQKKYFNMVGIKNPMCLEKYIW